MGTGGVRDLVMEAVEAKEGRRDAVAGRERAPPVGQE